MIDELRFLRILCIPDLDWEVLRARGGLATRRPSAANSALLEYCGCGCTAASTAFVRGQFVGFHAYHLKGTRDVTLHSDYTYVCRRWRRQGVALRLWERSLRAAQPWRVSAGAGGDRGYTLLTTLRRAHPSIKWDIWEAGDRPPRLLPKRRSNLRGEPFKMKCGRAASHAARAEYGVRETPGVPAILGPMESPVRGAHRRVPAARLHPISNTWRRND